MIRLIPSFVCLFLSAVSLALPNLTRRGLLFAVPVPAGFRASPIGRRTVAEYRALILAAAFADVCALLFSPERILGAALVASPLIVLAASTAAFLRERRKVLPFAIEPSPVREAVVSTTPDETPLSIWLGAGPFAILGAAAIYLNTHWDSIPARFAVHWDAAGQPNGWSERSFRGVYGPLLFGAEICLFMLALALGNLFGARRSSVRPVMLRVLTASNYLLSLVFAGLAVRPVLDIPVWIVIVVPVVLILAVVGAAVPKLRAANGPVDPTPNEAWKAGMFYYNPDDPALFVEKRAGVGYTLNFANRWSGFLMAWIGLMIASVFFLL